MRSPGRLSGGLLPRSVLQFSIHRKDKHSFPELDINISEETENLRSGNLTNLFAELVSPLGNQVLPQALDHFDTLRGLRQLALGRC